MLLPAARWIGFYDRKKRISFGWVRFVWGGRRNNWSRNRLSGCIGLLACALQNFKTDQQRGASIQRGKRFFNE